MPIADEHHLCITQFDLRIWKPILLGSDLKFGSRVSAVEYGKHFLPSLLYRAQVEPE